MKQSKWEDAASVREYFEYLYRVSPERTEPYMSLIYQHVSVLGWSEAISTVGSIFQVCKDFDQAMRLFPNACERRALRLTGGVA